MDASTVRWDAVTDSASGLSHAELVKAAEAAAKPLHGRDRGEAASGPRRRGPDQSGVPVRRVRRVHLNGSPRIFPPDTPVAGGAGRPTAPGHGSAPDKQVLTAPEHPERAVAAARVPLGRADLATAVGRVGGHETCHRGRTGRGELLYAADWFWDWIRGPGGDTPFTTRHTKRETCNHSEPLPAGIPEGSRYALVPLPGGPGDRVRVPEWG